MGIKEILEKIPAEGFLKISTGAASSLSAEERVVLIRKGNEFFNSGNYEQARRIFLTTGYTDGIIRMGDFYYDNHEPLEALRMYKIAPAPDRIDKMVEKISAILHKWLSEDMQ